jgi:hypothetical protein
MREPAQTVVRAVAARFEKRTGNYWAMVVIAVLVIWLTS